MNKTVIRIFGCFFLIPILLHYTPVKEGTATPIGDPSRTGGTILYVKEAGTSPSCTSWDDACSLQTALDLAVAGNEIWVAAGTYTPSPSDNGVYFSLVNGVAVYGGFAGTETSLSQRDWEINITTLSGEIGTPGDLTDNSRHIVTGSYLDSMTILDGFTINGGYNTDSWGSGLYCYHCDIQPYNLVITNNRGNQGGGMTFLYDSPTLTNVTFSNNTANYGGGLYTESSNPTLQDVTFDSNSAVLDGAGMCNYSYSHPTLTNVKFSNNIASNTGGAIYTYDGSLDVTNGSFVNNSAAGSGTLYKGGGAIYNFHFTTSTLTNVTFSGNSSAYYGGGIYNLQASTSTLTNVTFSGNSAFRGGGMANFVISPSTMTNVTFVGNSASDSGGGIYNYESSNTTIKNGILWNNTPSHVSNPSSNFYISYSDIQGGCPEQDYLSCSNIINTNPLLGTLNDNGGFSQTHALPSGSPAIDAGDPINYPPTDQRGYFRPIDGDAVPGARTDMGAYEFGSFELTGPILYVKVDAIGYCRSWADACDLQTALYHAIPGFQVWVARGSYKPTLALDPADPRTTTFQLMPGVAIYGGFFGTETALQQRNWNTNITTLSGDIGAIGNTTDNSYHVLVGNGVDDTAILDGFTIKLGNANGTAHNSGGGLFNTAASPTLANLSFAGNTALNGGGIYNDPTSNPTLTNIIFDGNSAEYGGGMYNNASSPVLNQVTFSENTAVQGGGMFGDYSSPVLTNVTFSKNLAGVWGGGMCNMNYSSPQLNFVTFSENGTTENSSWGGGMSNMYNSSPTLTNVAFIENFTDSYGGGMVNWDHCNPTLSNVTFSGNTSDLNGGGMRNYQTSNPTLTNVTFSFNIAGYDGGGMSNEYYSSPTLTNVTFFKNRALEGTGGGIDDHYYSSPLIRNTILWDNKPDQVFSELFSTPQLTYCDIEGGFSGTGNISTPPMLSPLADNGGFTHTHALELGSLAIDAGDPAGCPVTDQRGYFRPADGNADGTSRCDMGAFEFAARAPFIFMPLVLR
jgi:predicted outer membrane repeat protein